MVYFVDVLQKNTIYNEDCLVTMAKMPDSYVDLTVTSPPYDNLRTYNGYSFDFEKTAQALYRVTKDGGVVVWIVGDATIKGSETGTSFRQALYFKQIGFNLHDTMIYHKNMLSFPSPVRYNHCFEYMFILSKGKPASINLIADKLNTQRHNAVSGGYRKVDGSITQKSGKGRAIKQYGVRNGIWLVECGYNKSATDKMAYKHPAIFPERLAGDHIVSWSNKGDLVYDPFMGSGTTAKMAILNKRKYIGSEISREYCEIAQTRIDNTQTPLI